LLAAVACLVCGALSSSALAASGKPVFRPRIKNALGLVPPIGRHFREEGGTSPVAVTYHGGPVMNGTVEVHTIFWAPPGYTFQPAPPGASADYKGIIEKYLTDVSTAYSGASGCSSSDCNSFSILPQFGQGTTPASVQPGAGAVSYNTANPQDVIVDTNPYPSGGCSSPQDEKACILDQQVQDEVDHVITTVGGNRGLHDLWMVVLPPDVDECISPDVCGTNAFGGYHSLSNVGNGVAIYAVIIDPLIETQRTTLQGHDPQGFPDAESAVDTVAHETVEAMTDPLGIGWMDPNGYEIGDKCEFGPAVGTPLGYAPDGSPYNQVINGEQWWTQEMWSNADGFECVQGTTNSSDPLPLPQVSLKQYGSTVSGNTENNTAGIGVTVKLIRANANGAAVTVGQASGTTNGNGAWSVTLHHGRAVGDDRDEIDVIYSGAGAPTPKHQVILTGNGGNPWTESGWTGWTSINQGNVLTNHDEAPWSTPQTQGQPSLTMTPCFQTGVLAYRIDGTLGPVSPTAYCSTAFDTADTRLAGPVSRSDTVTDSSLDNRAFRPGDLRFANQSGGLVRLTVPVGEPDSTSPFVDPFGISPTGPASCTADLGAQAVTCIGLVPGAGYTITDGAQSKSGAADATGTLTKSMSIHRGDLVVLSNGSRNLTVLHVANLRVHIDGDSDTVASGICSPREYWGGPLTEAPANALAGEPTAVAGGSALTGEICPTSGSAAGLPTSSLGQTDERSGGQTVTEVADIADTSPMEGETMYGKFTALAETTDGKSPVSLTITPASGGKSVAGSSNVNTPNGSPISGLKPGNYTATWVVRNPNGDTRTVTTRFIEQAGLQGPSGKQGSSPKVKCHQATGKHNHHAMKCNVAFAKAANAHGTVRMRVTRGSSVAALGHGRLHNGSTTVQMRELRSLNSGTWRITLVYSSGRTQRTVTMRVLVV
jgi:hypothetical protein